MESSRIAILKGMLQESPNDPLGHYLLANEYFKAEHYPECIAELTTYLALADDEGAAFRTLAQAHERLGQVEQARAAYTKGIEHARRHNHPTMAVEFEEALSELGA